MNDGNGTCHTTYTKSKAILFCNTLQYPVPIVSLNRWQELSLIKQGFLSHSQRPPQRYKATYSLKHLVDLGGFALLHSHHASLDMAFKNKSAESVSVKYMVFPDPVKGAAGLSTAGSKSVPASSSAVSLPVLDAENVVKPVM